MHFKICAHIYKKAFFDAGFVYAFIPTKHSSISVLFILVLITKYIYIKCVVVLFLNSDTFQYNLDTVYRHNLRQHVDTT